jgi:uncharacterized membrane protein YesL
MAAAGCMDVSRRGILPIDMHLCKLLLGAFQYGFSPATAGLAAIARRGLQNP